MRCTNPSTVSFKSDGKTLEWSPKKYTKEYATFPIPCGKCAHCLLKRASETALRCMHEASLHENNSFITLTYSDEHLKSPRLVYQHWQKFMKDLRSYLFQETLDSLFPDLPQKYQRELWNKTPKPERDLHFQKIQISSLQTGEYGDQSKRPHFHAIIFNFRPKDSKLYRDNGLGDRIYTSELIDRIWGRNDPKFQPTQIGEVTFKSAGYVARYSLKKQAHGPKGSHNYEPICKRSSAQAIGKRWIEKHWRDVFNHGYCVLPGGAKMGVPRYYQEWFKKHHPEKWQHYVTQTKLKIMNELTRKEEKAQHDENVINLSRSHGHQISRNKVRDKILQSKIINLKNTRKI